MPFSGCTSMLMCVLVYFFVCVTPIPGISQPAGVQLEAGQQKIDFEVAFSRFKGDSANVFVEMCYSFFQSQLHVTRRDSQDLVLFGFETKFYNNDSLHAVRSWNGSSIITDPAKDEELFSLSQVMLVPGTYDVITRMKDLTTGNEETKRLKAVFSAVPSDKLALSDIQLAHSIQPDTSNSVFAKNGYQVLPNPREQYDIMNPILYFYSEIYNLGLSQEATYTVQYNILDSEGKTVKAFPARERPVKASSLVEVGGVNIVQLTTGDYNLELRVMDNASGQETVEKTPFHFMRTFQADSTVSQKRMQYLVDVYENYSEEDLKEEFEQLKYIITGDEKKIFKSLQLAGKRTFMADFWFKRDQMPETIDNEHRDEYFNRINLANIRYGPTGNGWQKDRGRVLVIYGEPDEVEKSHAVSSGRLYEIWRYFYVQSGVNFIFIDKNDNNNLELVHSTAHGEIRNYDWQSWLTGRGR